MTEKKEIKLFETDYRITGKHATYLKFIVNEAQIFNTFIEAYLNAAVFGFLANRKAKRDNESTDSANILASAFINHRHDCLFLYRLIMLLDEKDINLEERLDRAFRYDTDPSKYDKVQENLNIFNSYVLGGIEEMYNKFIIDCSSSEDYIKRTFEIVKTFKDEIDGVSYKEKIDKLLRM